MGLRFYRRPSRNRRTLRPRRTQSGLALVALSACTVLTATTQRAQASDSGSVVATVNVAPAEVRSLVVEIVTDTGLVTYDNCSDGISTSSDHLVLGSGYCSTQYPSVSVTNGALNSRIMVSANNFHPTTDPPTGPFSATWALAPFEPSRPNQVTVQEFEYGATDALGAAPICDTSFLANCTDPAGVAPGEVGLKYFQMYAPTSSTSNAPQWSNTVTWTAIAPS